jgi:hypothetical protein
LVSRFVQGLINPPDPDNIGHEVSRFVQGLINPPEPEISGQAINHDWLLV